MDNTAVVAVDTGVAGGKSVLGSRPLIHVRLSHSDLSRCAHSIDNRSEGGGKDGQTSRGKIEFHRGGSVLAIESKGKYSTSNKGGGEELLLCGRWFSELGFTSLGGGVSEILAGVLTGVLTGV